VNGDLVSFGDEKVNPLMRVGKRHKFASQIVAQFVARANLRLTERAALPEKIRRDQLVKAWPILLIDGIDQ